MFSNAAISITASHQSDDDIATRLARHLVTTWKRTKRPDREFGKFRARISGSEESWSDLVHTALTYYFQSVRTLRHEEFDPDIEDSIEDIVDDMMGDNYTSYSHVNPYCRMFIAVCDGIRKVAKAASEFRPRAFSQLDEIGIWTRTTELVKSAICLGQPGCESERMQIAADLFSILLHVSCVGAQMQLTLRRESSAVEWAKLFQAWAETFLNAGISEGDVIAHPTPISKSVARHGLQKLDSQIQKQCPEWSNLAEFQTARNRTQELLSRR
jgi:hypothetical protein